MVVEDGKSFVAVEGDVILDGLPFVLVNLDGELLRSAVVSTVWCDTEM